MSDTLLATKTRIPPLRSNLVNRSHLVQRLNDGITQNHCLTLVSAPAGYGKSTLLCEWVSQLDFPVAWLSLEKGENSPARFWNYFYKALSMIPGLHQLDIDESLFQALQSTQPPAMDTLLTDLLNQFFSLNTTALLVLDDLHTISEGQIHKDLIYLIDHLPQSRHGFHLVVASRMDPPWPLARWRVRDNLVEVRVKDLRFSLPESTTFLGEVMGLNLTHRDIELLEQRTEGWIAGLQLAALSMQSRSDVNGFLEGFSGTHHYVLDYLLEEVLGQQKPEFLDFLLYTSILEYLSGPLCDAITGSKDSQAMLIQLEKSNMFLVPMDDERHWYRFHHLFSELLRSRLKQAHPEIIPLLHGKACTWFSENGYISNALTHAIAANDIDHLVLLIEKYAFTIFDHHQASTFLSWLNTLPEAVMGSNPWLHIARAWLLAYLGRLEEIKSAVLEAEKHADRSDHRLMGYIAAMWTLIGELRSDRVDGLQYAGKAFELLPLDDYRPRAFVGYHMSNILAWMGSILPAINALDITLSWSQAAGDSEMAMTANFEKASLLHTLGRLKESLRFYDDTFKMVDSNYPDKKNRSLSVGYAYLKLSSLYLEWDNRSEALRLASEGIEICRWWGYQDFLYNGLIKYADVLLAIGDLDGALRTIQETKMVFSNNPITSRVRGQEAMIYVAKGNIQRASTWVEHCGLKPNDSVDYFHRYIYTHYSTILQAQGKFLEAQNVLENLANVLEQVGAVSLLLEIRTRQIIVSYMMKEEEQAFSMLQHTLELAKPEGFIRVFTSKGDLIRGLLQVAAKRGIEVDFINQLLLAFNAPASAIVFKLPVSHKTRSKTPAATLIEPLSERELQVLHLLDSSLTSTEIGRELYLSVNTIRTHIRNIYSKLGVNGRFEAVKKAKDLNLI